MIQTPHIAWAGRIKSSWQSNLYSFFLLNNNEWGVLFVHFLLIYDPVNLSEMTTPLEKWIAADPRQAYRFSLNRKGKKSNKIWTQVVSMMTRASRYEGHCWKTRISEKFCSCSEHVGHMHFQFHNKKQSQNKKVLTFKGSFFWIFSWQTKKGDFTSKLKGGCDPSQMGLLPCHNHYIQNCMSSISYLASLIIIQPLL